MGAYAVLSPDRTYEVLCNELGCENFGDPGCLNGQAQQTIEIHDSWHEGLGDELTPEPDPEEYEHAPFGTCGACNGSGRRWYGQCRDCQGDGVIPVEYF